jgi:hypothetical protein
MFEKSFFRVLSGNKTSMTSKTGIESSKIITDKIFFNYY